MGLFPAKEKIHFIYLLSSGDGPKKGKWLLGCSTLAGNDVLLEKPLLKLFFPESEQVCVYS